MSYATVMVSLALDQPNEARLEAACQIAERFDAGIVGIAASQFSPPLYFTSGEQAQDLIDQGQAALKKRMSELEAQFLGAARGRARSVEWRSAIDFPARYLLQQARCADIIVSGGPSDAFSDPFVLASPKDLVMQAGRPLLVVPDTTTWLDLRSMLVAWKDTTEARRAIVEFPAAVAQGRGTSPSPRSWKRTTAGRPRCHGFAMSWPGCRVTVSSPANWCRRKTAAATPQTELDRIAADVGAGVVVAGAYGHSRLRELILGGMTQHLITQTARSVLLSH